MALQEDSLLKLFLMIRIIENDFLNFNFVFLSQIKYFFYFYHLVLTYTEFFVGFIFFNKYNFLNLTEKFEFLS